MGVNIKQNSDASMGLQGTDLDDGAFVIVSIPYSTTSQLTQSAAVMARRMLVKSVSVVPDVASTNAVTVTAYKAPSATALGSGTALTGAMALNGTAATTVAGAIVAGTPDVGAGSRVGIVISGALGASGSGVVTMTLAPA
ncbi:MAG: hypothetical protein KGI52_01845 [Burkholderiales bacterium]|nr:hypothetical protein [Burkholderiales bacterium]